MAFDHRPVYLECAMNVGLWTGDTEPTAWDGPLEFSKIEIVPPVQEEVELLSNIEGSVGEATASVSKATAAAKITLEFMSMTADMLSLVLGSAATTINQTQAVVTDKAITGVLDSWVKVGDIFLSDATITVTKSAVPVDAAKWEVDRVAGLYRALHADAVGSVLISYTKSAATIEHHAAGKAKSSYIELYGRAKERHSGKVAVLDVSKATLKSGGAFDPVAGGFLKGTLTGTLATPAGKTAPWTFDLKNT